MRRTIGVLSSRFLHRFLHLRKLRPHDCVLDDALSLRGEKEVSAATQVGLNLERPCANHPRNGPLGHHPCSLHLTLGSPLPDNLIYSEHSVHPSSRSPESCPVLCAGQPVRRYMHICIGEVRLNGDGGKDRVSLD